MNDTVTTSSPPSLTSLGVLPHTVREFGVEARKPGKAWEAAFNGPIQSWADAKTGEIYGVHILGNEAPEQRHLPSKGDVELRRAQGFEQPRLRGGRRVSAPDSR